MKLKSGIIRFTRRRLLHSYFMLIIVWAIVIFLMHNVIGGWFPILWFGPSRKFDHDQLKRLMASVVPDENSTTLFANPLWQLLVPDNNFVHFFSLPKRKSHIIYGEVKFWSAFGIILISYYYIKLPICRNLKYQNIKEYLTQFC